MEGLAEVCHVVRTCTNKNGFSAVVTCSEVSPAQVTFADVGQHTLHHETHFQLLLPRLFVLETPAIQTAHANKPVGVSSRRICSI